MNTFYSHTVLHNTIYYKSKIKFIYAYHAHKFSEIVFCCNILKEKRSPIKFKLCKKYALMQTHTHAFKQYVVWKSFLFCYKTHLTKQPTCNNKTIGQKTTTTIATKTTKDTSNNNKIPMLLQQR